MIWFHRHQSPLCFVSERILSSDVEVHCIDKMMCERYLLLIVPTDATCAEDGIQTMEFYFVFQTFLQDTAINITSFVDFST